MWGSRAAQTSVGTGAPIKMQSHAVGLRCISSRLPGDADVVGPGTTP